MQELAAVTSQQPSVKELVKSQVEDQDTRQTLSKFERVFTQDGLLNNGYKYTIEMTSDAKPIAAPARRAPTQLMDKLKEELKCMEERGVIREVREATPWCAPTVIAYKKNNIRVCQDFRHFNQYIQRPQMQIPTLDEVSSQLNGATMFSTLDCEGGFHQIPIEEKSQLLLTFSTPFGRYCYKRLPMGLVSSPEVYQKIMHDLVVDIKGAICYIDDLVVYGKTKTEHAEALQSVLQRLT